MAAAMMAVASTSKDLSETVDDLTICSICLDTLKVPKYFSCLHTFCLSCIQGYLESSLKDRIPRSVNCPVCRAKIPVPNSIRNAEDWSRKLPVNHIIMSLIDAKKMQEEKAHFCSPCKKLDQEKNTVAKLFCVECKEALCEACSKYHKAFKAFLDHELIEIGKISDAHLKMGTQYNTCSDHLKKIELYCEDHQKPCCFHCVTLEHRKCNDVIAIDEAAKKLRSGDAYLNLMNAFGSLTRYFNKAIDERDYELTNCQYDEKRAKDKVQSVRKDIEKHLLKLEQKCIDQISFSYGSNTSILSKSKQEFEEKRKMVIHCQKMLKAGLQSNSDVQLLFDYKNMQAQKEDFERFLSENQDTSYTNVVVNVENSVLNITDQTENFATVTEEETSLMDIKSSLLECSADPHYRYFEMTRLTEDSRYSGLACHDAHVLIVDRFKRKLCIFDQDGGGFLGKVKLKPSNNKPSAPWDVCGSTSGKCIVSFPDSRVLADVDIREQSVSRYIQVDNPITGISFYNNTIISSYRSGDHTTDKVFVHDMNGNVLREHPTCRPNYVCTDEMGRIFCCQGEENRLVCMNYDFEPVFTYRHQQLRGISGITTDEEGNVYVAGFTSNNVHQLTPAGTLNKIILTGSNGISNPRGISFMKDSDFLVVLNNAGQNIEVFELV